MKFIFFNDKKKIIYFNRYYIKGLDITSKESIEEFLKEIFIRLNDVYNINLCGFYNVYLYNDKKSGLIIKLLEEDSDYYNYSLDELEMRLIIKDCNDFLYEIDDLFNINLDILNCSKVYIYNEKVYLKLLKKISEYQLGILLENSEITYEFTDRIINKGKVVNITSNTSNN